MILTVIAMVISMVSWIVIESVVSGGALECAWVGALDRAFDCDWACGVDCDGDCDLNL